MVTETIVMIIIGILGFLGGTGLSHYYLTRRYSYQTINKSEQNSLLDARLSRIEERMDKLEEKATTLEDLILSNHKDIDISNSNNSRHNEKKYAKEEEEIINLKIMVLYKNGYSIRQIAKELGLSKSTVHRRLKTLQNSKN